MNQILYCKEKCLSNNGDLKEIGWNSRIQMFMAYKNYRLKIEYPDGNIQISCKLNYTVKQLKQKIAESVSAPTHCQSLAFKRQDMWNDDKKLYEYDIYPECTIHLQIFAIDAKLVHILEYHELYEDLYSLLNKREIDMESLRCLTDDEFNEFCNEFGLSQAKGDKFRRLMKIVKDYDDKQYHSEMLQGEIPDDTMKLLIIGDIGVGKTSLIQRYIDNDFSEDPLPTTGMDEVNKKEELNDDSIMKLIIWDTAGEEKYNSLSATYYRDKDCIMICYDTNDPESFKKVDKWRDHIDDYGADEAVIMLVGCKSDLSMENRFGYEEKAQTIINQDKWKKYNTIYVECSARTGDNVRNVFIAAAELVLQKRKALKREGGFPRRIDDTVTFNEETASSSNRGASSSCTCY